jgi:xanthine dehydrogenase accessory factor
MNENRSIIQFYKRDPQVRYALATVVRVFGSSYRSPGAKMIVSESGEISGSISGGCLERDLIRRAIDSFRHDQSTLIRYDTRAEADDDAGEFLVQSAGLGCEGVIEIFLEPNPARHVSAIEHCLSENRAVDFELALPDGEIYLDQIQPPHQLTLFGAGPDIIPMIDIGHALGWELSVVDCKSAFPVPRRLFNKADKIYSLPPEGILGSLTFDSQSLVALMTHNYEHDRIILEQLAELPALKYLGILGPKVRGEKLLKELNESGKKLSAQHIHFPIGLDIGAENSQAIALSVFAEMQSILSERSGAFLKDRKNAIHSGKS